MILVIWSYHMMLFCCSVLQTGVSQSGGDGGSNDVEQPARPAHREEPPQIADTAGHTRHNMAISLLCLRMDLERLGIARRGACGPHLPCCHLVAKAKLHAILLNNQVDENSALLTLESVEIDTNHDETEALIHRLATAPDDWRA